MDITEEYEQLGNSEHQQPDEKLLLYFFLDRYRLFNLYKILFTHSLALPFNFIDSCGNNITLETFIESEKAITPNVSQNNFTDKNFQNSYLDHKKDIRLLAPLLQLKDNNSSFFINININIDNNGDLTEFSNECKSLDGSDKSKFGNAGYFKYIKFDAPFVFDNKPALDIIKKELFKNKKELFKNDELNIELTTQNLKNCKITCRFFLYGEENYNKIFEEDKNKITKIFVADDVIISSKNYLKEIYKICDNNPKPEIILLPCSHYNKLVKIAMGNYKVSSFGSDFIPNDGTNGMYDEYHNECNTGVLFGTLNSECKKLVVNNTEFPINTTYYTNFYGSDKIRKQSSLYYGDRKHCRDYNFLGLALYYYYLADKANSANSVNIVDNIKTGGRVIKSRISRISKKAKRSKKTKKAKRSKKTKRSRKL